MIPALRQAAPRLTRQLFQCSHRPSSKCSKTTSAVRPRPILEAFSRSIRTLNSSSPQCASQTFASPFSSKATSRWQLRFPNLRAKKTEGRTDATAQKGFFPRTSEKVVAYWLLGSAASVFGIVVFGGLTRLTESGYGQCEMILPLC